MVFVGIPLPEVDQVDCLIEGGTDLAVLLPLKGQIVHDFRRHPQAVPELPGVDVNPLQLRLQVKLLWTAAKTVHGQLLALFFGVDGECLVVPVHALDNLAVQIGYVLGMVAPASGADAQFHVPALHGLGNHQLSLEPGMVLSVPCLGAARRDGLPQLFPGTLGPPALRGSHMPVLLVVTGHVFDALHRLPLCDNAVSQPVQLLKYPLSQIIHDVFSS